VGHVHVTCNFICLKQMMFQKGVLEDEAQILPEVEAAIVNLVFKKWLQRMNR